MAEESFNRRRSQRDTTKINYSNNYGVDELKWTKLLETKYFASDPFQRLSGNRITLDWARRSGFRKPVVIVEMDGLGMEMPDKSITVLTINER